MLHPYPVLVERDGSLVVHLKFTALLMGTGTQRITGVALPMELVQTDKVPDEEIQALLNQSTKKKKKKKKKKAAAEDVNME